MMMTGLLNRNEHCGPKIKSPVCLSLYYEIHENTDGNFVRHTLLFLYQADVLTKWSTTFRKTSRKNIVIGCKNNGQWWYRCVKTDIADGLGSLPNRKKHKAEFAWHPFSAPHLNGCKNKRGSFRRAYHMSRNSVADCVSLFFCGFVKRMSMAFWCCDVMYHLPMFFRGTSVI